MIRAPDGAGNAEDDAEAKQRDSTRRCWRSTGDFNFLTHL
jgi:hypothetical protein